MRALLFSVLPLLCAFTQPDLPEPYNSVEVLPYDPHGWYANEEQITNLLAGGWIKTVVEVGSWLGKSTIHIASLLPEDGKVYAVDHWLGSVEHQPGGDAHHVALPYLYQQFLSNVIHAGMTHKIVPVRMDSLSGVHEIRARGVYVDMVYIDAGHDFNSVYADLNAWYPLVKGHGVLCGDDWVWESVRDAVRLFAKQNKLKIWPVNNFWMVVKK